MLEVTNRREAKAGSRCFAYQAYHVRAGHATLYNTKSTSEGTPYRVLKVGLHSHRLTKYTVRAKYWILQNGRLRRTNGFTTIAWVATEAEAMRIVRGMVTRNFAGTPNEWATFQYVMREQIGVQVNGLSGIAYR